jgi:hypothetical protein
LPCPPSVEAFSAPLGVSSSSLSCTFISGLCSPMITFFSFSFFGLIRPNYHFWIV